MAEITRLNPQQLPGPLENERFELYCDRVAELVYKRLDRNLKLTGLRQALVEVDSALVMREAVQQHLSEQQRPANKKELADHLSVLRIAFPNAKAAGDGFGRILIERVAAKQPTIGALDWSVRRLIDSCRFLPEISDVLNALAIAQDRISTVAGYVDKLPKLRREIAALIPDAEREEAWERQAVEHKRALADATKVACQEILGDGSDEALRTLLYSKDEATKARVKLLRDQLMQGQTESLA